VFTFAGSVNSGFAVDDEWIIEKNDVAHDASDLGRIFSSDYWVARGSQGRLYRPLTILTYAWNHAAGGLNPSGYHLVNVLLHALVSVLVFRVVRALGASLGIGLAAGVLYAVHPIHAEAVSNIVGRAELLSTAGVLAALLAHVAACREPGTSCAFRLHVASLAAFAVAIFCKENAITFVIVPALYDALFLRGGTTTAWGAVRKNLRWHVGYAVAGFVYLMVRDAVLGGLTIEAIGVEDNPIANLEAGTRIMTAVALVARYAGLMVFPKTLSYIYGPGAITPVTSLAEPRFLAGAAILAGFVVLTVLAWRRNPFLAFWGAFVLATFSIASNILVPIGTGFAERLLYLPSVGMLALAAFGLARLAAVLPASENVRQLAFAGLVVVLAIAGAWRSFVRDLDWRSNKILFLSQERTPVRSSQSTFNAGLMHFEDKAYDRAMSLFRESIDLYPTAKALYFVGRTHGAMGSDAERERTYQETTERFPGSFYAEMANGWLLSRKDKYAEALPHFQQALKLTPTDGGARYNVGVALIRTNDVQGAVTVLKERLDIGEMAAERRELLAKAHDALGNSKAAAEARQGRGSALSDVVAPVRGGSPAASGFGLMKEGRYLEAKKTFQEALAADPRDYSARLGMGVVSYNLGDDVVATSVLGSLRSESRKLEESGYLALALAYQRQERHADAVSVLEDAVILYPASASLLERLAFIEYSVLKQYEKAAPRFRKLLELSPDHPRRSEIEAALEWLKNHGY
jgi:tetratricopeptide (TPR) repeat protein